MIDIQRTRDEYLAERSRYERLAQYVKGVLEQEIRRLGLSCSVTARVKDIDSFVKKVLRKRRHEPEKPVRDRAGARVVTVEQSELAEIEAAVDSRFCVLEREDTATRLEKDRFGYLGVHLQVTTRSDDSAVPPDIMNLECEVQLRTISQDMWAQISHRFIYKGGLVVRPLIERRLTRLAALAEMVDESVALTRKEVRMLPGYARVGMLERLERRYLALTGRPYDEQLSLELIEHLLEAYDEATPEEIWKRVDDFVSANYDRLEKLYERYKTDDTHVLLFQPESLMIFERLEGAPHRLKHVWSNEWPPDLLEDLADVWGVPL